MDIQAIRGWLKTLDEEDYKGHRKYQRLDRLPKPLKSLSFGVVSLSEDKDGNPEIRISGGEASTIGEQ